MKNVAIFWFFFEIGNFRKSWISIDFRKFSIFPIFEKFQLKSNFFENFRFQKFSEFFQTFLKSISKNFYRTDFQNFGIWIKLRLTSTKNIYSTFTECLLKTSVDPPQVWLGRSDKIRPHFLSIKKNKTISLFWLFVTPSEPRRAIKFLRKSKKSPKKKSAFGRN